MRLLAEIGLCLQTAYSAFFMWVKFTTLYTYFFFLVTVLNTASKHWWAVCGCAVSKGLVLRYDRQAGTFGVLEICPSVNLADTVGGKQETPSQRNKV